MKKTGNKKNKHRKQERTLGAKKKTLETRKKDTGNERETKRH